MLKPQATVVLPFIVLRERLTTAPRPRQTEPMLMDDPDAVVEFHAAGTSDGPMTGIHEMNAKLMSKLLPRGGTVLDLGCGSGRLIARLAHHRPDIRITGFDLSEPMLVTAKDMVAAEKLGGRINLERADITDFAAQAPDDVSLVSCNLALHHLPTRTDLDRCLEQVAAVRKRTGCAIWLADFARMRNAHSFSAFLGLIQGGTDQELATRDGLMSEAAGWSFDELSEAVHRTEGLRDLVSSCMKLLPSYQAHWCRGVNGATNAHRSHAQLWKSTGPSLGARVETAVMKIGFPGTP